MRAQFISLIKQVFTIIAELLSAEESFGQISNTYSMLIDNKRSL